MTSEATRLLWAYQAGIEHAERNFEAMTQQIYRLGPQIGSDELMGRLWERELREEQQDNKVLNAFLETP